MITPEPTSFHPPETMFPKRFIVSVLFIVSPWTAGPVQAQMFDRVTDVGNPIVAETRDSGGATWFDADNDGDLDLFVANGNLSDEPNSLFLNNGFGAFSVAPNAGDLTTDAEPSIGGAVGDYDGDGDLDIFVTNRTVSLNALYQNDGGTFNRIVSGEIATDEEDSNVSAWIDIDSDGDLDLFVTNFNAENFLYLNESGRLSRTSADPITSVTSPSINGNWADVDGDGDPDYFMGNGGSTDDVLYYNEGGLAFSPDSFSDGNSTIGSSWGDYDNDGDLDLFVSYFLEANNGLFLNAGPPEYLLAPVSSDPVTMDAGMSTGSVWGDVDNDGDLDLFVSNFQQNNALYLNAGPPDYDFVKLAGEEIVTDGGDSFGSSFADYDEDGDLDVLVNNVNGHANFLYENNLSGVNWLQLDLVAVSPNTTAIGARVTLTATIGGVVRTQYREVLAQTGYNSQNLRLHFGLADAHDATVDVVWPSGATSTLADVTANQILVVDEETTTEIHEGPSLGERLRVYPNPMSNGAQIVYNVHEPDEINLAVFDLLGRRVRTLVDEVQARGEHLLSWDGRDDGGARIPSGAFLLVMRNGGLKTTQLITRIL